MYGNGTLLVVFHQILLLLLFLASWGIACCLNSDSMDIFEGVWPFIGQIHGQGLFWSGSPGWHLWLQDFREQSEQDS